MPFRACNRLAYLSSGDVGVYALFLQSRAGKEDFYLKLGMIRAKLQPDIFLFALEPCELGLKNLKI